MEGVRVFVRVRPPLSEDVLFDTAVVASGDEVQLSDGKRSAACRYERVFPETAAQSHVFDAVRPRKWPCVCMRAVSREGLSIP